MLKNFKNLKGAQVLSKNEQKAVNGGAFGEGNNDTEACSIGYTSVCGYIDTGWCWVPIWKCTCVPNGPGGQGEVM